MIPEAQVLRLGLRPLHSALFGSEPDGLKDRGQGGDELFQPGREIGLASAEVIVVVRMDGQSSIVSRLISSVVHLQREGAVKAAAAFMQDEGSQQASRPDVAVVIGGGW